MLKPTRYDLYEKALNKQPKTKIDKRMITVEDALHFADWLATRYERSANGTWYAQRVRVEDADKVYTTRELWELYQQSVLGKKSKPG